MPNCHWTSTVGSWVRSSLEIHRTRISPIHCNASRGCFILCQIQCLQCRISQVLEKTDPSIHGKWDVCYRFRKHARVGPAKAKVGWFSLIDIYESRCSFFYLISHVIQSSTLLKGWPQSPLKCFESFESLQRNFCLSAGLSWAELENGGSFPLLPSFFLSFL